MLLTQSRKKIVLLVVAALMVMSLPLAVAAQTADTMANGITAPKEGATVSGAVAVTGYASDPNFLKWQLDLLPGGDASAAAFLALGETQGVFTYTLNTIGLPNGEHALRLRVVRNDSNYTEYTTKFTIANGAAAPAATAAPAAAATPVATATPAAVAAAATAVTSNGFVTPREGATVSGVVEIRGNATSADFMKWQLDLLPGSDPNAAAFLAFGEEQGVFTHTLNTTNLPQGEHSLRLRVVRQDSNYDEYLVKFTIGPATAAVAARATAAAPVAARATAAAPTAAAVTTTTTAATPEAMTNGITALKEGATVSGAVAVTGYASDPNFLKWQLDLLPGGDASAAAFLALGETQGVFTYTLNTIGLPNGEHALRLRVVRNDSNYTEYTTKFTIAN